MEEFKVVGGEALPEESAVKGATMPNKEKNEFDAVESLKRKAELFGVSERQLENEFVDYKAAKLLKKLMMKIPSGVDERAFRDSVQTAAKLGLGGVWVTPVRVARAKEIIQSGDMEIISSIIASEPEEFPKVRLAAAKAVKASGVQAGYVPFSFSAFSSGTLKATEKEIKKLVKLYKGKRLAAIIDVGAATQSELNISVKAFIDGGMNTVALRATESDVAKVKTVVALCGDRLTVEVLGSFSLSVCGTLFSLGVDKIISRGAAKVGEELVEKIRSGR